MPYMKIGNLKFRKAPWDRKNYDLTAVARRGNMRVTVYMTETHARFRVFAKGKPEQFLQVSFPLDTEMVAAWLDEAFEYLGSHTTKDFSEMKNLALRR